MHNPYIGGFIFQSNRKSMMSSKRFFLILTLIGMLSLAVSCTGGKKSRCEECPEFTQLPSENNFLLNHQNVSEYETHKSIDVGTIVCSGNE